MTCRPVIFDPFEWLYVMRLAKTMLPELSFHKDEEAAERAGGLGGVSIEVLKDFDWGRPVVYMPPFERLTDGSVVVAAEGYTAKRLQRRGVKVDVVVSDFDFEPDGVALAKVAVVHVHGDNYWLIPAKPWVYTVQTWPRGCTVNVSGFTDGDRAVYLSYYMGAREIVISGFYPHVIVKRDEAVKRKKLALASYLLRRIALKIPVYLL
jgi:Uncharacterized Rossmann fold enzyme